MAKSTKKSSSKANANNGVPSTPKKLRQSPEIEGFYRFLFENNLNREAYEILTQIQIDRKKAAAAAKA